MLEGLVYLVTSFWLGAIHAATPGHGKTIAASYIVGVRGRPVDALVLGIFVTLSHTSGIVLVAVLATLGSAALIPQRVEGYLAVFTGLLVIAIGGWMLRAQTRSLVGSDVAAHLDHAHTEASLHHHRHHHHGHHAHASRVAEHPPHHHVHAGETGRHVHGAAAPTGIAEPTPNYHRHGWGRAHTHDLEAIAQARPSLTMLLGLGIAGGLLPDPAALAMLLAALANGKVMLGLLTVVVFSLGFASVLVVVGVVAAHMGRLILTWLSSRYVAWVQIGTAVIIIGVGLVLTTNALRGVAALG